MFYIAHSGVKNMKWGVRRYQNYDGTLTPEGKARYAKYREDNREATYKSRHQVNKERKEFTNPNRYLRKLKNPQHIERMSDDELIEATRNLQAENNYRAALSKKAAYIDKIAWEDKSALGKIVTAGKKAIDYKLSNIGGKYIESMAGSLGGVDLTYYKDMNEKNAKETLDRATKIGKAASAAKGAKKAVDTADKLNKLRKNPIVKLVLKGAGVPFV